MTEWLFLTEDQRRISLEQAFLRSGIQSKAIEKDWWVTLSLKALFNTAFASHCIFKGGTSLSKGWKLISRFSEDIDIALAPEAFAMSYKEAPSHSYVKKLKRMGCACTSTRIKEALEQSFAELGVPEGMITIVPEPVLPSQPDKDPQALLIRYPSLLDEHPYLASQVKMEFGVRSLKEPYDTIFMQSILSEVFPSPAFTETPFPVEAVEPRKTLLEKLFLLHEKFSGRYPENAAGDRQSRHLYDIVSLIPTPAAQAVLDDRSFYDQLLTHRKHYVRLPAVNYDELTPGSLMFVPRVELQDIFRNDYLEMQRTMIYGTSPDFEELLLQLKIFNGRFRLIGTGWTLEKVIDHFSTVHASALREDPDQLIISLPIDLPLAGGNTVTCQLKMVKRKGAWLYEDIRMNGSTTAETTSK